MRNTGRPLVSRLSRGIVHLVRPKSSARLNLPSRGGSNPELPTEHKLDPLRRMHDARPAPLRLAGDAPAPGCNLGGRVSRPRRGRGEARLSLVRRLRRQSRRRCDGASHSGRSSLRPSPLHRRPRRRRGGAGARFCKALLDHAAAIARAAGCDMVRLTSGFQREAAHGFYEAQGMSKTGFTFRMLLTDRGKG